MMNEQDKRYIRQSAKLLDECRRLLAEAFSPSDHISKQIERVLFHNKKIITSAHQNKDRPEPTEWR